jgi:general stress protein YciG
VAIRLPVGDVAVGRTAVRRGGRDGLQVVRRERRLDLGRQRQARPAGQVTQLAQQRSRAQLVGDRGGFDEWLARGRPAAAPGRGLL